MRFFIGIMSSKAQSEQSSASSSTSSPSRPSARSLIVSKVSLTKEESWLFNDLSRNYADVKRVLRNRDQDGNELGSIRVDFDSDEVVAKILDHGVIYIKNREYYIRPYWPLVCYRCQNEGHIAMECPQYSLPEWRLTKLIDKQKSNFKRMIEDFEYRWSTRLDQFEIPESVDHPQLLPVANNLTNVCQQLNKQNVQMQQQLSSIAHRLQNSPTKVNN